MCASNWQHSWEDSPDESNSSHRYRIDNVGLQHGLGFPVQLLNMPQAREFQNHRGGNYRQPNFVQGWNSNKLQTNSIPQEVELEKTVDGIPIRCVYVKNIHSNVSRADLFSLLKRYGHIVNILLRVNKHNNTRQYAFVTFRSPADATRLMREGKVTDCFSRKVYITAADSWHQPKETEDGDIICPGQRPQGAQKESQDDLEVIEVPLKKVQIVQEEGLNSLNDDCLMHIFSFLTWQQIAGLERVCKRWQCISYQMWRGLRELNVTKPPFDKLPYTTPVLEHCLKRCGESLTTLELCAPDNTYDKATLAIIAKYCTNLETLHLSDLCIGKRTLAHLGRQSTHLKKLVLDRCTKFNDFDLMSLLPRCAQLSHLELKNCNLITGQSLAKVTDSMTTLVLHKCPKLDMVHLKEGLQKMSQSLRELTLVGCGSGANGYTLGSMIELVPNLTSLSLCNVLSFSNLTENSLSTIGSLSHLTHLNLSRNSLVSDQNITCIVEGCEQLRSLDLSSCGSSLMKKLGEDGLSLLGRLRMLTSLDISYLLATTDKALKNITTRNTKLKSLVCRGCPKITDEGSSQVVAVSNDLEVFDLSGCDIGTETVSAAQTSVKMRTNNVPLRLIVGGTEVSSDKYVGEEAVPQLTIDLTDHSIDNMRPDYIDDLFFPYSDDDDFDVDFDDDEDVEDFDHEMMHHLMEGIGCCDCNIYGFDDMCDPTLCEYHDDTLLQFGTIDDNSDEYGNNGYDDYDGNDAEEIYQPDKEDGSNVQNSTAEKDSTVEETWD